MPDTRPDLTGVAAVAVTACPLLAAYLTALHPDLDLGGLRMALLTRIAGIGTLRDRDGLLLLTHDDQAAATTGTGRGHYDDLSGHRLGRCGRVGAGGHAAGPHVRVLPDQDAQLVALLTQHLGATA